MRLGLVGNRKLHIGQEKCAVLFNTSKSGLKRLFTGHVRKGGKQYVMRLGLVGNRKLHIGQEKCAVLFNTSKSGLKRLFTGHVRKGGKQYMEERERAAELAQMQYKAEKAERQQAAAAQLVGQTTTVVQIGDICHVCGQGFNSQLELHDHLVEHQKLARWFTCPW